MNQNVYLNKQARSLNTGPSSPTMELFKIKDELTKAFNDNMPKEKETIELEPAPEVEFCSDKRKRIARNVQKVFGFSHGGTSKKKKKKKR